MVPLTKNLFVSIHDERLLNKHLYEWLFVQD